MIIRRGDNWNDERIGRRTTRRHVENRINHRTAAGLLMPTRRGVELQSGPPAHWQGAWDFSHAQLDAPLQIYTRDSTDPGNRALMGINPSHRPDVWVTWKAHNVNACEPGISDDGTEVSYNGLWNGTDWRLVYAPNKVKDFIELFDLSVAPNQFVWTVKRAPGCHLEPRTNGVHLVDSDGVSHGRITYPIAWDDNGSAENPNIRVTMSFGAPIGNFQTIVIKINEEDRAAAVGSITIDPEVQISGTTDIGDTSLRSNVPAANWAAFTNLYSGSNQLWQMLIKVNSAAIPEGTLDDVQMVAARSDASVYIDFYKIFEGNVWNEGNSSGSPEVGAACYSHAQYDTVPWLSGTGGLVPGTDCETDYFAHVLFNLYLQYLARPLPTSLFTEWRDGYNNGMVGFSSGGARCALRSTEDGTLPLYFDITYTEDGGISRPPPTFFDRRS